jgi:hypothetical protein
MKTGRWLLGEDSPGFDAQKSNSLHTIVYQLLIPGQCCMFSSSSFVSPGRIEDLPNQASDQGLAILSPNHI